MYEYIVREGDSLTSIANNFDITIEEILKVNNNIINENQITIGDIIKIPNLYIEKITPPKLQDGLLRGIDISELNGNLDWEIINEYYKKGHIDFIIIRLAENWKSRRFAHSERTLSPVGRECSGTRRCRHRQERRSPTNW